MDTPHLSQAAELAQAVRRAAEAVARPTDDELWERLRADPLNADAVAELYRRWSSPLRYRGMQRGLSRSDADEVLHDAFVKLLRRRPEKAFGFLWRVVYRDAVRRRERDARRDARQRTGAAVADAADPRPTGTPDRELASAVDAALERLSESQRMAFVLRHAMGLSVAEVAALMLCGERTVEEYVARARERLASLLSRWRDALPAAGVAGVPLVTASVASASPEEAAVAAVSILARLRAAPAVWGLGKVALLVGAVFAAGGLALGGWALTRDRTPEPDAPRKADASPAEPAAEPKAKRLDVPARTRTIFERDVRAKAEAALLKLAAGEGSVSLSWVEYPDCRVMAEFAVEHRVPGLKPMTSRVRMLHTPEGRAPVPKARSLDNILWVSVRGDPREFGRVDLTRPIVLAQIFGREVVLRPEPLAEFVQAFEALPKDEHTAVEWGELPGRIRAAAEPYVGEWRVRGAPDRRWRVEISEDLPHLNYAPPPGKPGAPGGGGPWMFYLTANNELRGIGFANSRVRFLPDRIEFVDTGEVLERVPVRP